VRTRWTLPRNRDEENQDRIWSNWATFRPPDAFEYDPTSINRKLLVNATMGKGKLPFRASLWNAFIRLRKSNRSLCISRPSSDKEAARPRRDGKNRQNRCRIPTGMHCGGMHPAGSPNHSNQKADKTCSAASKPLCSTTHVWLSGSRLGGWSVLQTATNDFRVFGERQNVANDYKRLQSVAKRRFANFSVPKGPCQFLIR
jgi:hypothetical protein